MSDVTLQWEKRIFRVDGIVTGETLANIVAKHNLQGWSVDINKIGDPNQFFVKYNIEFSRMVKE
jgi:hypothetical protein